ncbi:MAG: cytochrome-c peroxidase [Phycisphaerales bacterium JB065]
MSRPARTRRTTGARLIPVILASASVALISCKEQPAPRPATDAPAPTPLTVSAETASLILSLSPPPLPPADPTNRLSSDPRAAHFGRFLFFDSALSGSANMNCATCHKPELAFTDGLPVAEGAAVGTRNTPSILNAAHFPWLNWDGSADTLWMQAARPLEAAHELNSTRTTLAKAIALDPDRRAAYEAIFGELPPASRFKSMPDRATPSAEADSPERRAWQTMSEPDQDLATQVFVNICKAIAAYEHRLTSRNSPFDRFASAVATGDLQEWANQGNPGFGQTELAGFELFAGEADCIACHAGPFFSDFAFHSVRVAPTAGPPQIDPGRFDGLGTVMTNPLNSAGPHSDDPQSSRAQRLTYLTNPGTNWGRFRTPSLRNVAVTAPYMHAGQFESLDRVLDHYSTFKDALPPDHHDAQERLLRPLNLSPDQRTAIIAFLHALTDIPSDPNLGTPPDSPIPPPDQAKTGH